MVQIISRENAHLYGDVLDDMFRMRYRVAVDEWGWRIPGIAPGYDRDAFDTDETVYFACLNAPGARVVACGRLNPTTGPHLLSEIFSDHCHFEPPPRASDVYELSRYIVDHGALSKEDAVAIRGRISAAFNLFCLRAGIRAITALTYLSSYTRGLRYWPTRPLGRPTYHEQDNATYIAARMEMHPAGLEKLRAAFSLGESEPYLYGRLECSSLPALQRVRSAIRRHHIAA